LLFGQLYSHIRTWFCDQSWENVLTESFPSLFSPLLAANFPRFLRLSPPPGQHFPYFSTPPARFSFYLACFFLLSCAFGFGLLFYCCRRRSADASVAVGRAAHTNTHTHTHVHGLGQHTHTHRETHQYRRTYLLHSSVLEAPPEVMVFISAAVRREFRERKITKQ